MGKVIDEVSGQKPAKPQKGKTGGGAFRSFLTTLVTTKQYKPMQGWYTRLYTALGLGLLALGAVWSAYQSSLDYEPAVRFALPAVLAAVLGWTIYRTVHYPPFAEFLIATEAEMNKVSWTTKDDLYRSTMVVLAAVVLLAFYLFVVDWFWLFLLRMINVLQFSGGGSLGSTS